MLTPRDPCAAGTIATRAFSEADQDRFASLSGDRNPMHVDAVAARRTPAGARVVHGVHATLWALDELARRGLLEGPVASLQAQFQKFAYLDVPVALEVVERTPSSLRVALIAERLVCVALHVVLGAPSTTASPARRADPISVPSAPFVYEVADLEERAGRLGLPADRRVAQAFPHAARALGAARVEALGMLSTLIGMICPGLHSLFSGFSITFIDDADDSETVDFRVRRVERRIRLVDVSVSGAGVMGSVTAFVRHPSVAAPSLLDLRGVVAEAEFSATTALVIGGSRGLGALTARAIAAGGGRVIITYASGEADARAVAADIGARACRVLRYDAREDAALQLAGLDWNVTQLYYFATPHIFRQKAGWFEPKRFAEFCCIYVDGFAAACDAARAHADGTLLAFYPSSTAVEDRPANMTEYSMAKAAGELLCADMNRFAKGVRTLVRRLPRVLTDQTATMMPYKSIGALEAMLPVIRAMHAAT